jgi:hypothetical protein
MFLAVVIYGLYLGIIYSSFKKYYTKSQDANQQLEYTFTDEKVLFKTPKSEISIKWDVFSKVENTKHVLLFSRPGIRNKVPFLKNWFSSEELNQLTAFIKSNNSFRKIGFK